MPPRPPETSLGALSVGYVRELVTTVVESRIAAGDRHLTLLSGLDLFGPDDVDDLHDELHPTPEGYLRIAERFSRLVLEPGGVWADRV